MAEEENHEFNIIVKSMAGDLYVVPFVYEDNLNYHLVGIRENLIKMYPDAFSEDSFPYMRFFYENDDICEGQMISVVVNDNRPICQYCSERFVSHDCVDWSEDPEDRCKSCDRENNIHWHPGCPCPSE